MMLPLWTNVTLFLLFAIAYWIAERMRRSLPSFEMGFTPKLVVSGKRSFLYCAGKFSFRNAATFLPSSVPAANSMPA